MTLNLDDPRLAQLLTDMVDRRVRAALDTQARIRYGTVSAVDTTARTASLLLGGSLTPSPGFVYPPHTPPIVGDLVRAVNRGADRYIEAVLAASAHAEPTRIGRSVAATATQTAVTATTLRLTHQSLLWGDGVTTYTSGSIQVGMAGLYAVTAHAEIQSSSSGPWRILGVGRNAGGHPSTWGGFGEPTNHAFAVSYATPGLGTIRHHAAFVVPLAVGDWLASFVYQDSGSSLTISNQLLTAVRIGP